MLFHVLNADSSRWSDRQVRRLATTTTIVGAVNKQRLTNLKSTCILWSVQRRHQLQRSSTLRNSSMNCTRYLISLVVSWHVCVRACVCLHKLGVIFSGRWKFPNAFEWEKDSRSGIWPFDLQIQHGHDVWFTVSNAPVLFLNGKLFSLHRITICWRVEKNDRIEWQFSGLHRDRITCGRNFCPLFCLF